eukprot:6469436-Amphidinium_carterae.1
MKLQCDILCWDWKTRATQGLQDLVLNMCKVNQSGWRRQQGQTCHSCGDYGLELTALYNKTLAPPIRTPNCLVKNRTTQ